MVRNADCIENAIGPQWPGGQYAYGFGGTDEPQRSQRTKSVSCGRRGSGSTDTPTKQYIWGTYIDECIQLNLLVAAGPQSVPAGAYYLLQDLLYRAVALTNSGGYVVESYDTDAYGNTLIFTAPGADGVWFTDDDVQSNFGANEIIYCGYRFDSESRLYYVRNRNYNPVLGRWIQRDPIGYQGGINLYGYVGGGPVGAADPDGLRGLNILIGAPGVSTAFDFGYDKTISTNSDLDGLWAKIRSAVGKFDPSGKCGNCVSSLTMKAHGLTDANASRLASRYIWIVGGQYYRTSPPFNRLHGRFLLGTFGQNSASNPALTGGTVAFFQKVKTVECNKGVHVTFMGCNTGTRKAGRRMLREIQMITGGDVTGYNTSINLYLGFPVVDLNAAGTVTIPAFGGDTVTACPGGSVATVPLAAPPGYVTDVNGNLQVVPP